MKFSPSLLALLAFLTVGAASAQTPEQQPSRQTRPRTVTVIPPPSQQPVAPQPPPSQQTQTPAQPQPAIVIPPITRQSTSPSSTQSAPPQQAALTPPAAPSLI